MTTLNYKNSKIETILTSDNDPVYVAIIDGNFYTTETVDEDANEDVVIEKAKKIIDENLKRKSCI